MMFFFIFILISFKSTHIFVVNGEGFRRDDYNEVRKGLIFEKFKDFFGFKGYNTKNPSNWNSVYGSVSLSPAPAPAPVPGPAPAPAPMVHTNVPHHHPHPKRFVHKILPKNEKRGVAKRVLIAVIVSVGAAFVMFGLGFIWVCRKFGKKGRGAEISVLATINGGGDKGKSVKKVRSDPDLSRFYLESIESAFKAHAFCNVPSEDSSSSCKIIEIIESREETKKSNIEFVESSLGNVSFHENTEQSSSKIVESNTGMVPFHETAVKSDCENVNSSFGIVSLHENAISVRCDMDGFNPIVGNGFRDECLSDNESFHSLCSSHSSNVGPSNASAECLSPKGLNFLPDSEISTASLSLESTSSLKMESKVGFKGPPPPPPPPPLPRHLHVSPSHLSSRSTPIKPKPLMSSELPILLSPSNSGSSLKLNQPPQHDLPPNHLGGVPPPPGPPPQPVQLGKDGAPLAKLKPLHWDKVRAAPDRSMVWDKLRTNSFEFDEEMMESLFGYNFRSCSKSDEAKSKSPSPTKHLLEPKRLQNITILSKAVNVTAEQVCEALVQGEGLYLQQLEALAKMVPTIEEETKLLSYKGDTNSLSSAEIFVKTILNIPHAFSRIEGLLYRETFEDEVVHLCKSFSMLEEACKELRSSRLFLKLLEAVLKTGNRMNVGTMRGGARAFKLDALLKLADVKGTDGKTTLLHFVVKEIVRSEGMRVSESIMGKINLRSKSNNVEEKEENCWKMGLDLVSGLSTELCNVKKTATIDLDVLASSVSNLSDGIIKLKLLLGKDLFLNEKSGTFSCSIKSFLGYAERSIEELREDEARVLLRVREVTEYFHGNVSKDEANPLRIFVIVRDFLGLLDHVCKELRSSKASSSPSPLSPFR